MASTSENTFGSILRRAQDLLTYILGFVGYNPPRAQESTAGMTTLINSIIAINATESSQYANYRSAVDARQIAFINRPGSIDKLLSPIKGAVDAQYGKKSAEAIIINSIIKKMRSTKLPKTPSSTTVPTEASLAKVISQSERSYGSMTQSFNDIINSLTQFVGYNPTNNSLKVASLQTTATQITALNNAVAQKIQLLNATRSGRHVFYSDLKDRVQRIKSYVKAQYGTSSPEYKLIKGIKI